MMVRRNLILLVAALFCFAALILPVSAAVSQYNFTDGSYTYHIFNGTGNSTWTVPTGVTSAWVLVIGGGGSGGGGSGADGNNYGGGGGAGALLNGTMSLTPSASIPLTVGAGGSPGNNGGFSQFNDTEIAAGGGGGVGAGGTTTNGKQGGSGGGAGSITPAGFVGGASNATSGLSLTAYGNRGGYSQSASPSSGGGGGGAGAAGQNGTVSTAANGGAGLLLNITGTPKYYAAGGGANNNTFAGAGGSFIDCDGNATSSSSFNAQNGRNGTGSGGGGGWSATYTYRSYGGSGVVIVRYLTPSAPTATFTANTTGGVGNVAVAFTDTSTGSPAVSAWNWSFKNVTGNNTEVWFSTVQNPVWTFSTGNYLIKLNATNTLGSNVSLQTTWVNVTGSTPNATFTANTTSGIEPQGVVFNDTSANFPTSWSWLFNNVTGNNTWVQFSTSQNTTYTFLIGNWSIRLNATNAIGSNTSAQVTFINITSGKPIASFNVNTTSGTEPLPVSFTDTSTLSPTSWSWTFQNVTGNNTVVQFSTAQNPVWTFRTGNYRINLSATNIYGTNESVQTTFVNTSVLGSPTANFTGSPLVGLAPTTVTFTDSSTGTSITSWSWNFGDGQTSTQQNPTHTYAYSGTYSPSLTVMNVLGGTGTLTRSNYIQVNLTHTNTTDISIGGSPQLVQFHVQTIWGAPLVGATVQIQGIETTTDPGEVQFSDVNGFATIVYSVSCGVMKYGANV